MSQNFGFIEKVEMLGNEIQITGHKYVALAVNHDDPYIISRLIDVEKDDLTTKNIKEINDINDYYDSTVEKENNLVTVIFNIDENIKIIFHCKDILTNYRYYNIEELTEILKWLPKDQINTFSDNIEKHGFSVISTINGEQVTKL